MLFLQTLKEGNDDLKQEIGDLKEETFENKLAAVESRFNDQLEVKAIFNVLKEKEK